VPAARCCSSQSGSATTDSVTIITSFSVSSTSTQFKMLGCRNILVLAKARLAKDAFSPASSVTAARNADTCPIAAPSSALLLALNCFHHQPRF
jgi:hypothetical protein